MDRYLFMAIHRSWSVGAATGGILLGVVSVLWLAKTVKLLAVNATCCPRTADNDGLRGLFFAMSALGFQLVTLVVAVAVVGHRMQRIALAAIILWIAIGGVLLMDDGANVQLQLNLVALVVAGLAVVADLLVARRRSVRGLRPASAS